MKRSKKVTFQLLICFGICMVTTLSFAENIKDVTVVNPDNQPVPVKNVENPAHSPFFAFFGGTFEDVESLGKNFNIGTIPIGKRLVIEHIGFFCEADLNNSFPLANISVYKGFPNGDSMSNPIPILMMFQGKFGRTPTHYGSWVASQTFRLYSDGVGLPIYIYIENEYSNLDRKTSCKGSVLGYTVDVP